MEGDLWRDAIFFPLVLLGSPMKVVTLTELLYTTNKFSNIKNFESLALRALMNHYGTGSTHPMNGLLTWKTLFIKIAALIVGSLLDSSNTV